MVAWIVVVLDIVVCRKYCIPSQCANILGRMVAEGILFGLVLFVCMAITGGAKGKADVQMHMYVGARPKGDGHASVDKCLPSYFFFQHLYPSVPISRRFA